MFDTNKKLTSIIDNYKKPTLIYDLNLIENKMRFLKEICENTPIKMLFTIKSFPFQEIISLAHQIMPGFEISNLNEYQLLPKNLTNSIVSVNDPTGSVNTKIPNELMDHNRCYIHLDKLDRDEIFPYENKANVSYGTRVSHSSLIDCQNSYVTESRFGTSITDFNELKYLFSNHKIKGLHLHNGSEKNTMDDYLTMVDALLYTIKKEQIPISFINLGGGIHYLNQKELTFLVQELSKRFTPLNIQGFFEPGRYVAEHCGYALGKIMSIKQLNPKKYCLLLDLSNECHLKWSEQLILMNKNQPALGAPSAKDAIQVFIGGSTCFEHDCLGIFNISPIDGKLPFQPNEILTFGNINGYSAAWNIAFNGIDKADLVFI